MKMQRLRAGWASCTAKALPLRERKGKRCGWRGCGSGEEAREREGGIFTATERPRKTSRETRRLAFFSRCTGVEKLLSTTPRETDLGFGTSVVPISKSSPFPTPSTALHLSPTPPSSSVFMRSYIPISLECYCAYLVPTMLYFLAFMNFLCSPLKLSSSSSSACLLLFLLPLLLVDRTAVGFHHIVREPHIQWKVTEESSVKQKKGPREHWIIDLH